MAARTYDSSRWTSKRQFLHGKPSTPTEVSINYISCSPPKGTQSKGTILLIHGFPQTSYQFRHVITPLADAGYLVIAPDYRGAGESSRPRDGYDKFTMAADLHTLITSHLNIKDKIHVIGHDIGGMVAHAFAAKFPDATASVAWGECPLPGTSIYDQYVKDSAHGGLWHFVFHWQLDIPEMLTQGKERQYLKSFYDRLTQHPSAISATDVDHYAELFAQPGAMRAGFDLYRAFHQDSEDNAKLVKQQGKSKVPCCALWGELSFMIEIAEEQAKDMYEEVTLAKVEGTGHWCAEENPESYVKEVLRWVGKH
ncbi:alpha/beta-hydrolase [Aureobasidium pullulans]|nr:alpha/beta-hydrolase [Aureobasidium pullulans]